MFPCLDYCNSLLAGFLLTFPPLCFFFVLFCLFVSQPRSQNDPFKNIKSECEPAHTPNNSLASQIILRKSQPTILNYFPFIVLKDHLTAWWALMCLCNFNPWSPSKVGSKLNPIGACWRTSGARIPHPIPKGLKSFFISSKSKVFFLCRELLVHRKKLFGKRKGECVKEVGRWREDVRKKGMLAVRKRGRQNAQRSLESCELQGFSEPRHHLNPSCHYDYKAIYLFQWYYLTDWIKHFMT